MRLASIGLVCYYVQLFVLPELQEQKRMLSGHSESSHYTLMNVWTDGQQQVQMAQEDLDLNIKLEHADSDFPEYVELIQSLIHFRMVVVDTAKPCHEPMPFEQIYSE
jgi:hypothetical protein